MLYFQEEKLIITVKTNPVTFTELQLLAVFIRAAAQRFPRFSTQPAVKHFTVPTHSAALKTQN